MYTEFGGWIMAIWNPIHAMFQSFLVYVPYLVVCLLVLFIGGLLARIVAGAIRSGLRHMQLDELVKNTGIGKSLSEGGHKGSLSDSIGTFFHWIILLGVLASALNVLGVSVAGTLLHSVLGYVPSVLSAMFILVIGILISKFVTTLVSVVAKNVHFAEHPLLITLVKYSILVYSAVLALSQLKVDTVVVHDMLMLLFGALCLGTAIAYGIRKGNDKDTDFTKLLQF